MQNEVFSHNLAALKRKYPSLASNIQTVMVDENCYRVVEAETGEPNLIVAGSENFLFLYDNRNPYDYCKKFFEGMNLIYAPVVLFLGFGLGYHLHMFTKLFGEKLQTKKIIVFEKDIKLFRLAMELIDFSSIIDHPAIYFFVGEDPSDAFTRIRKEIAPDPAAIYYARSVKVIPLPAHIFLAEEYYKNALEVTRMAFRQTMVLAGNDPSDSFLGIDNMLGNIKPVVSHPGINKLQNKFKDIPAVTVASGPSLERNMHLLKDMRDSALIIACDSAFLPLMKRDIRPHIVASLERTAGQGMFYKDIPSVDGIYLAFCPLVVPDLYESFPGEKIIVFRPFSHFNWFHMDKGTLEIGPAVSNMTFAIAKYLGCNPIVMIGQDLAFAEDGDTHVEDMRFGERDEYYHASIIEAEGNSGKPVKTSRTWEIFKAAHEEDIASYSGLCINATEGGAKISGARIMTLAEASEKYCGKKFFPDAVIANSLSEFRRNLNIHDEIAAIVSRCKATRQALEEGICVLSAYQVEVLELQRNMVRPFLYEGAEVDSGYLLSVARKFSAVMDKFLSDENVYDIMSHTLQPLILWFTNKINYLREVYTHDDCLHAQQILMLKDLLGAIGQLFVSTVDALERAEKSLAAELER